MSAEENKATVMRFDEEVWNRRNPAAIDALVTSDYVLYAPGSPPLDREGHKQFTAAMLAAFSDARSTTHDLVAEGDKVAWRWSFRGMHTGAFMGIPPTGKEVTLTGISVLRLEGGKIAEQRAEADMLGLMQQLGAVPAPQGATA
jgi:steroid delta-isomerase-like uncharacterized protein